MIRRAIGTTLAGLCALTGPLAGGAFAATTDPALTTSASTARPGVAFTVSPTGTAPGCPASSGVQTVALTFTDHAGATHAIGSTETDEDGIWASALAQLPVAGLDADGNWTASPVTPGVGTLAAACFAGEAAEDDGEADDTTDPGDDSASDPSDDSADPGEDDSTDPGEDDSTDPGEDDGEDDSAEATRTYPGISFNAAGHASALTLSATMLKPGDSVTVSAAQGCAATGVSQVSVALIALTATDEDEGDEDGDVDEGDDGDGNEDGDTDDGDDLGGASVATTTTVTLPSATATTSTTGTWSAVTLTLPAGIETGDYAVTADCTTSGALTSSYDAEPVAVGTVLIGAAACGPLAATSALTGTYSGEITSKDEDLLLPSKLKLSGDGPWKIRLRSAATGALLASRTVSCDKARYELDASKNGLSDSNKPRVRVCNAGRAPVTALLRVLKEKEFQRVDKEVLEPGDCVWLTGSKLNKGGHAKLQVLIDAPGKGSDDVVTSFTVKRGRR